MSAVKTICTYEMVIARVRDNVAVSYRTDNHEQIAEELGFDRCQVADVFYYLKRGSREGRLCRLRVDIPEEVNERDRRRPPLREIIFFPTH